MSAKEEFIAHIREKYKEDLNAKEVKETARKKVIDLLNQYFSEIANSLEQEREIAGNQLSITSKGNTWEITEDKGYLRIILNNETLSVHFRRNYAVANKNDIEFTLRGEEFYNSELRAAFSEEYLDTALLAAFKA